MSSKLSDTVTVPSDSHRRLNHLYTVLLACGICASIYVTCIRVSWTPIYTSVTVISSQILTVFFNFQYTRTQPSTDWWDTALNSLDLLTICLPPLFPAALTLVNFISLYRLHRRGFRFCQPFNPSTLIHQTAAADSVAFFPVFMIFLNNFIFIFYFKIIS